MMKTVRFLGILFISWTMLALPAAAQNSGRQDTPATLGICDGLADATPGLQGLCVAMCEAQACEAEINPVTGELDYAPSCKPSAPRLVANYNKLAEPGDPAMPCVKVACPCWTQEQLTTIGGAAGDQCIGNDSSLFLQGGGVNGGVGEFASASNIVFNGGSFRACSSNESSFSLSAHDLSPDVAAQCIQTLRQECTARGLMD